MSDTRTRFEYATPNVAARTGVSGDAVLESRLTEALAGGEE